MAFAIKTSSEDIWREENLPDFTETFLSSNIEPQDGKIYVMYHGTTLRAAIQIIHNGFIASAETGNMLGAGVYVSRDIEKAERYPLNNQGDQVVLKLRVNVGKVLKIDRQGHPLLHTWHEEGYDTAWVPEYCGMVESGLEEYCVWNPNRIKVVGMVEVVSTHLGFLDMIYLMCLCGRNH